MESLKRAIRDFIGVTQLHRDNYNLACEVHALRKYIQGSEELTRVLITQVVAGYKPDIRSEDEIKAESKRIAIMVAEHKARKHTLGEL